ncbi:MAG: Diadenosine hexaphosphate hydrolase [Candidatus Dichloromethanomonas elyunquensis]|nr:MAG: Diadenosine hexaphosphate hydrolase [Candidatus Dichloromethanomonas elyunquensis]
MPQICNEFHYCPICGSGLENMLIESKVRKKCPGCSYIHWGEYSVGVGGVLLQEKRGLIVQRAINPGRGRWTIPGGYVEQNEKIADAVVREMKEETGILTEPVSILAVKDRPEDARGVKHDIYIVFLLRYVGGKLFPDPGEVMQAGFFSPEECSGFNIAPLSLHVIRKAIEYGEQGCRNPGFILKEDIQISGSLSELFILP